ncbi:MAG: DUF4352 domain-containing protein [Rhodothermales bacterium]
MHPIGNLLMGLSFLALVAGGGVLVYALRTDRPALARHVGMFALGWGALYLIVLFGTSLLSEEHVLHLNERKDFCGFYLDCHLGVSVEHVAQATYVGEGALQETATGMFYLITVRVDNDGVQADIPLLNPRATLHDARGRTYERALEAEKALAASEGTSVAFARRLPAGSSYTKTLVFDVPANVTSPTLLITKGVAVERFIELFLIGDEDSFLHRKTVFDVS